MKATSNRLQLPTAWLVQLVSMSNQSVLCIWHHFHKPSESWFGWIQLLILRLNPNQAMHAYAAGRASTAWLPTYPACSLSPEVHGCAPHANVLSHVQDVNKDPGAEDTFKAIGEAYEVRQQFHLMCMTSEQLLCLTSTCWGGFIGPLVCRSSCCCSGNCQNNSSTRDLSMLRATISSVGRWCPSSITTCTASFSRLCLQVLSDDNKRAIYDKYGEAGLKGERFRWHGGHGWFPEYQPHGPL